ncbi:MAG TPA: S41 family peptidase [Candidatus Elarobacter sp.]|nr:S41 family peptidase [Candidatus Elarobacter sp.]
MNRMLVIAGALAALGSAVPVLAAADDPARQVAVGAAVQLETVYVYPSRGRQAGEKLRTNAAAGAYDGLRTDALAKKLTADIATVLHDKHVEVEYSEEPLPPPRAASATPDPERRSAFAAMLRQGGYGLGRVAHLPGNVGYLDVRFFPDMQTEPRTVFDGMVDAVAYSDAIILDLRRNHGGSPESIARLLSHFLAPKTHVNDFVGRGDGEGRVVESTYTEAVPGPQISAPVYVLTSHETFSGGEECAYDVQALKRGTLIGEVTGGGANPGGERVIDAHFSMFVPNGRARNPITMTNWEGVGVKPDIPTAADRALATAYGMVLDAKLRGESGATGGPQRFPMLRALRPKLDTMTDAEILAL